MVKSAVGDEPRLRAVEGRLLRYGVPAEVGLVVGKLSPATDRGLVYDLIPTPPTDSGTPACTLRSDAGSRDDKKKGLKGGKGSSDPVPLLWIDGEWVAEHARQVSRMLLGGMYVIGPYVWASEASFKATSSSVFSQIIRGIGQAASWFGSDSDERLLIHISYSPRRWACQKCIFASGSLRPCEFKMSKLINSIQTFRCMYNFEMRIPIMQAEALRSNIKTVLHKRISCLAKELQSSKALIDGQLLSGNQPCTSEGPHTVDLLLPYKEYASTEACSSGDVAGLIAFSGTIFASAYLGPKEPVSQAISDLQGDIINSLRSRLDIISDESEGDVDLKISSEASGEISVQKSTHHLVLHKLRHPYCLSFPRRVVVPWLAGISICDYLQSSETFEDLRDRCKEIMPTEASIDISAMEEPETVAISVAIRSFWDAITGESAYLLGRSNSNSRKPEDRTQGSGKRSSHMSFHVAIVILLLSVLIGLTVTILGPKKAAH